MTNIQDSTETACLYLMGSYYGIAAGIDRYSHMTGGYIPILAFALELRQVFENETATEAYDVGRIS